MGGLSVASSGIRPNVLFLIYSDWLLPDVSASDVIRDHSHWQKISSRVTYRGKMETVTTVYPLMMNH